MSRPDTTSPSRRALLAGAPAVAVAGLAAGTVVNVLAIAEAKASTLDPILAAIAAHKAASRAFSKAVRLQSRLECELPKERRQSDMDEAIETDDPRWIAAVRAVDETGDQVWERALELLNARPLTLSGMVALFRHVAEADEADLPSDVSFEDADRGLSFEGALLSVAADWLEQGEPLRA
jgi:hypothetical protein